MGRDFMLILPGLLVVLLPSAFGIGLGRGQCVAQRGDGFPDLLSHGRGALNR
jgi:hypothetical protein